MRGSARQGPNNVVPFRVPRCLAGVLDPVHPKGKSASASLYICVGLLHQSAIMGLV